MDKHILPEDEAFLAHYGVKGMKWGVRKSDKRYTDNTNRRTRKADDKWAKKGQKSIRNMEVHNAMADYFNRRISSINDKPKYKEVEDFQNPVAGQEALVKEYFTEINDLTKKGYDYAVKTVLGESPSGFFKAELIESGDGAGGVQIVVNEKED